MSSVQFVQSMIELCAVSSLASSVFCYPAGQDLHDNASLVSEYVPLPQIWHEGGDEGGEKGAAKLPGLQLIHACSLLFASSFPVGQY